MDSQVLSVFPKFRRTQRYEYLIKITNMVNTFKENMLILMNLNESILILHMFDN